MATAGDGYEMGGRGVGRGVDGGGGAGVGQNLEVEAGSRKRKAAAISSDSNNLARNGEDLEVDSDSQSISMESQSLSMEIKNLRSYLVRAVKKLGYYEENKRLRVEMDFVRKQNEEVQAKNECLRKNIVEMQENQIDTKRKQLQQLDGLYNTMEFPLTGFEEDKSCDEDSNSKIVDESSSEKSAVNGKADNENLKHLELQLAKLDAEIQIKMGKLDEMLEREKFSEELGSATLFKCIQTNMELQDLRQELKKEFGHKIKCGRIGVKRLGEINKLPLGEACLQKYGNDEAEIEATILTSHWDRELQDPSWHPFKMADVRLQEFVDDDDAKLKQLRTEYGDDVYNAVKTALIERNEYNPSGRYPVLELWNFEEGRIATVKEAFCHVLRQMRVRREA